MWFLPFRGLWCTKKHDEEENKSNPNPTSLCADIKRWSSCLTPERPLKLLPFILCLSRSGSSVLYVLSPFCLDSIVPFFAGVNLRSQLPKCCLSSGWKERNSLIKTCLCLNPFWVHHWLLQLWIQEANMGNLKTEDRAIKSILTTGLSDEHLQR